jgi:hypothetical protein
LIDEERLTVLIAIAVVHGIQKVGLLFVLAENGLISTKSILRAWLFWRTPKPYDSIIFINDTVSSRNSAPLEDGVILDIGLNLEGTNLGANDAKDCSRRVYWAE